MRFDGSRLVGLADLHRQRMKTRAQRRLTDPLVYKHSNWYNEILQEELAEAPTGYQLQVFHWSIESGVRQAFVDGLVDGSGRADGGGGGRMRCLDAVSMIIGPSMEYRFGVSTHPQLGGTVCRRLERLASGAPGDQYRQLLPRCPRVLDACNGCSWYFRRGGDGHANDGVGDGGRCVFDGLRADVDSGADTDDDADGGCEDMLFFRITLRKFRRTTSTTYNAATGRQIRMNVRKVKSNLCTIVET